MCDTVSLGFKDGVEILEEPHPEKSFYQVWFWPEGVARPEGVAQPTVDMGAVLLYHGSQVQRLEEWTPERVRQQLRFLGHTVAEVGKLVQVLEGLMGGLERALDGLLRLRVGWDGEGAPKPSEDAVARARAILRWLVELGIYSITVEPDVVGGASLFAESQDGRKTAWVACMNDGTVTLTLTEVGVPGAKCYPWGTETKYKLLAFFGLMVPPGDSVA